MLHEFLVNFIAKHSRAERDSRTKSARRDGAEAPGNDKPFFVYYPMSHIHGEIVRTPGSKPGADEAQLYTDNIEYMDKLVGRLMAEIDRLHLREKTLVLFTSDNGTSGEYPRRPSVDGKPLSGHKLKLLEGGSPVPLITNWPGVTPAGKVVNDLVDFNDFFPTFADLGGAKQPEGVKLDGRSFAPRLRGEKGTPRDWVFVQLGDKWYVRDRSFKLTSSGDFLDMSDAPFSGTRATDDSEKAKLQAVLEQLNPAGGKAVSAGK